MSKETEDLLRIFALIAVFVCIIGVALCRIRNLEKQIYKLEHAPADTVTVVKHDTIKIDSPVPVYKYIKEKEYITIKDSLIVVDTVTKFIELPREFLVYKDSSYRAVVSGVQPRLDSLTLFPKTRIEYITKTVTKEVPKRWGIGVQLGAGLVKDKLQPYIGAGIQYNLITF